MNSKKREKMRRENIELLSFHVRAYHTKEGEFVILICHLPDLPARSILERNPGMHIRVEPSLMPVINSAFLPPKSVQSA